MIVDTMSNQEIIDQFEKDCKGRFSSFITAKLSDNKYRRYIIKNLSSECVHYFAPIYYESQNGINYVVLPNTKGKSDFKKNGLLYTYFIYYTKKNGIYAMMPCGHNSREAAYSRFSFYTPHLFDRYRERELKDITINKMDVILEFFKNNPTTIVDSIDNPKYENSLFGVTKQGVLLGSKISESMYEMRTYIPSEMLKGNQPEMRDFSKNVLDKYVAEIQ